MKLSKVQITNFRCFESLPIPLQEDINVFVGVNGAGKTTILDAIAVALYDVVAANGGGGKRQRANQKVNLRQSDLHITPGSTDPIEGRRDFMQVDASAAGFYPLSGFPAHTPTGADNLIEWTDHIRYTPPNDFSYETRQSEKLSSVYEYFAALWTELRKNPSALIPLPAIAYYRADRRLRDMPGLGDIKQKLERHGAYDGALNAGADYEGMVHWMYLRENNELREKQQLRKDADFEFADLRAVRAAIKRSIDNVESIFFRDSSLAISLKEPGGAPKVLLLEQLSDGYRNWLAIILDFARRLAQANPHFENPLEAPGILLIDEIELHLHPGWQQTVITRLRETFPNTQLVLTTHSPQVLSTVRKEQVHFISDFHKLESLPSDVGTYGVESSYALEQVFGVKSRPPSSLPPVKHLEQYLDLVERGLHEGSEAKALRQSLENDLGQSDPALVRADIRIRQLAILNRKK